MLRRLLAILALSVPAAALAQEHPELHYYRGYIGEQPWQLELYMEDGVVRGRLTHDYAPLVLEAGGSFSESDNSVIVRFGTPGAELSGTLIGEPDPAGVFAGTMLGVHGLMDFRFEQVAEYVDFHIRQGRLDMLSTYPYFTSPRLANMNEYVQPDVMASQLEFMQLAQEADIEGLVRHEWWFDSWTTIEYAAPGLLSALVTVNEYAGGAHPNRQYWSYNLAYLGTRLRPFELEDLFLDDADYLGLLSPLVMEDLLEQGGADWIEDGTITSLGDEDLAVFTVSPSGLNFIFPPYAVGPWVSGTFLVQVPLETVAPLLDPAGPAAGMQPPTDADDAD